MTEIPLLALETSTRASSVAFGVARMDGSAGFHLLEERTLSADRRATADLIPAIADMLRRHGVAARDVQIVAFSHGPGSFTGLRIAATIARTFAALPACRAIAVPTLEVLVQTAMEAALDAQSIVAAIPARDEHFYARRFERPAPDSSLRSVGKAVVMSKDALLELIAGAGVLIYPESKTELRLPPAVRPLTGVAAVPQARHVARRAVQLAAAGNFTAPAEIVPFYLRPPECELVYEQRRAAARARRGK